MENKNIIQELLHLWREWKFSGWYITTTIQILYTNYIALVQGLSSDLGCSSGPEEVCTERSPIH